MAWVVPASAAQSTSAAPRATASGTTLQAAGARTVGLPTAGPSAIPGEGSDLPQWDGGSRENADKVTNQEATSRNWAGQIDTGPAGTTFTSVTGYWRVPTVLPSANRKATATWIGIGGVGTSRLIQTGTSETTSGNTTTYSAWYELLPASSVRINDPVSPGNAMEAVIDETAADEWQIQIEDVTKGWVAKGTVAYTAGAATTAEWITERPEITGTLATLADFGSTRFTHLKMTGTNVSRATPTAVQMANTQGQVIAFPGAVSPATTGNFTDYYGSTATAHTTSAPTAQSSTTTIASSKNPSVYGSAVTLTAAVSPTTGGGSVTFSLTGGAIHGCAGESLERLDGSYRATCTTASLPSGSDVVAATYTGDTDYAGSHADLTENVTASAATYTRIYGETADATAAQELEHQFTAAAGTCPGTAGSRSVVLATDATYPDALVSAYLDRSLGTGTLLTPGTSLSSATRTALRDEGITRVDVVGATAAISAAVVDQLESTPVYECGGSTALSGKTIDVTRLSGSTEYTTAADIAETPASTHVGRVDLSGAYGKYNDTTAAESAAPVESGSLATAILASGTEFQDAEAASTLSYAQSLPILLTTPSALSAQAATAIAKLGIEQIILMGGQDAVGNAVVSSLERLGVSVLRVAGATYGETATELASLETAAAPTGFGWTGTGGVTVARGDAFTDGLAGAIVAADGPSSGEPEPLLLTESPTNVGQALADFLHAAGTAGIGGVAVSQLTVLGGPDAIVQTTINSMAGDL